MPTIDFNYAPIPVHASFHESRAAERFLFGAFGSGKTWAGVAEAIAWCLEVPGIRGLIVRKTVPALRDSTEKEFFTLLPHELYAAGDLRRASGHAESFVFPNGSEVLFRAVDDWQKLRSMNLGFVFYDEADEFTEEEYNGIKSRLRQKEPTAQAKALGITEVTKRGIWAACNPAGHNWLWRKAVNPDTREPQIDYFKSTSFDNPYLPPEFIEDLLRYPKQWIKRYVLCQFDDFAGQIYEEWNWDEHVIKDELKINPNNVFWQAFDPGTRDPNAGLWVVLDHDGRISGNARSLIAVAEYQKPDLAANVVAKEWRQIEAQHKMNVRWRVADPGAINVRDRGSNMTLADQYRRLGYQFNLGPKDENDRIPMLGQLIQMRRFKVTPACPMTFDAIKNYQWEDLSPAMKRKGVDAPEKALHKDSHLVVCGQYLSSKFVRPPSRARTKPELTFAEEVSRNIKRQMRAKRSPSAPIV